MLVHILNTYNMSSKQQHNPTNYEDVYMRLYEVMLLFIVSRQIVTANPWNSVAILCGVFMALFKAANFAKLSVSWMIKMRKRHLRNKAREMSSVT